MKKARKRGSHEPINFWDSFVFKFSSRILLGLIIVVIFLSISQCTIKTPESPSWNTNFVVPVINRTYTMQELIDKADQPELFIDTNGQVAFAITEDIDPVGLSTDDFAANDLNYAANRDLGPISIDPPSISPVTVSLSSISGMSSALPGDSAVVVAGGFNLYNNLPTIDNFNTAAIHSGTMTVSIANNLDINLEIVQFSIYDITTDMIVAADTFQTIIFAGTTGQMNIDLAGKTMSNNLRLDVYCYTSGGVVTNFSARSISSGLTFNNDIEVTSANAQVPAFSDLQFASALEINLNSGETLESAVISSGNLNMNLTNNTALDATVTVTIPTLSSGGAPYTVIRSINAGSTINIVQNLQNYNVVPYNDSVEVSISAYIPGSGSNFVDVDQYDDISFDAAISNLSFGAVTGIFNSNEVAVNESLTDIDIPEGFDNVELVEAMLTLEVENGVDMPGTVACTLQADNGKSLVISGNIDARGLETTRLSSITNSDVADFITPLPTNIDVNGAITFGDGSSHTIMPGDSVFARVNIYAPMYVRLDNAEITDLDVESSEINQEDIDIITDHFITGRFIYEITNRLPLGVTAVISMDGDSATLYTSPQFVLDTIKADPAPVTLGTGISSDAVVTTGEIYLDSVDIKILENPMLYIRPEVFLTSSDPNGVKLIDTDYITISGRVEVEYLFDGDL